MNKEAVLKKIVIYCPNLNEEVTLKTGDFKLWGYMTGYSSICGVFITIDNCKCDKSHNIEL